MIDQIYPHLPTLNAVLNSLATVILIYGYVAIKQGRPDRHKKAMLSALGVSAAFLTSYLIYHYSAPEMTPYEGEGWDRTLYYFILATHIPLAIVVVPGCFAAIIYALKGNLARHVRIVKWLWPVWIYVSITGVLIYLMLYVW